MGGNSSKSRKIKYGVSHTADGDIIITSSINSSGKASEKNAGEKKKKKKSSVKIKEKRTGKKSFRGKDSPSSLANFSDSAGNSPAPTGPVYRKKSSCPSCEAKDILLGKNRSRSGSDKSLRFSDFNKILRKTRVYDWEMAPADIPLYEVEEPKLDEICYICEVYTGSHVRTCRVCCRAYHDGCLSKIGHALNENSRRLIGAERWSCHQCMSLNYLLTQEEVKSVLEELEDLEIPQENITEDDYIKFHRHSHQQENKMFTSEKEQNCLKRYRSVVHAKTGTISVSQFLDLESLRILSRRCKDSLVHLLTPAELWEARQVFQSLDPNKTGMITRAAAQSSLFVTRSQGNAWFHDGSIKFIDEDLDSLVTWADFLRDSAIYILGQRSNIRDTKRQDSANDDTEDGTLTFSSCNSLDADDEHYNTCTSDLEPGTSLNEQNSGQRGALADGSLEDNISPLNTSTMVDELNSEMDKFCSRHEADRVQAESGLDTDKTPASSLERHCTCASSRAPGQETKQVPFDQSDIPPTADKSAGTQKSGRRSFVDPRPSSERIRSSLYNDSRHTPIPWEDVENSPCRKDHESGRTRSAHRRSEVIPRQTPTTSGQARAVSQIGCRSGRNVLAPAYGNLVGRINNEDWGC